MTTPQTPERLSDEHWLAIKKEHSLRTHSALSAEGDRARASESSLAAALAEERALTEKLRADLAATVAEWNRDRDALSEAKAENERLEKENARLAVESEHYRRDTREADRDLSEVRAALAAMTSERDRFKALYESDGSPDATALAAVVAKLRGDLAAATAEWNRATAKRDAAERERVKLDLDLRAANAELLEAEAGMESAMQQLAESRAAHAEAEKRRDEFDRLWQDERAAHVASMWSLSEARSSLASTQRELAETQRLLTSSKEATRLLSDRLAMSEASLASTQRQLEEALRELAIEKLRNATTQQPQHAVVTWTSGSNVPSQPSAAKEQGARCGHGDCKTDCGYGR